MRSTQAIALRASVCQATRAYTLKEAVAIAEAQGVLTTPAQTCTSSATVPPAFQEPCFIGCDPLRGAFKTLLDDPVLAANASCARPPLLGGAHSHVRLQGTVKLVAHVVRQSGTNAEHGWQASLLVDVPILAISASEPDVDVASTATQTAVLEVRGRLLPNTVADLVGVPGHTDRQLDAPEVETKLLNALKDRFESKRVLVSGSLHLDKVGCHIDLHDSELLHSLQILDG